MSNGDCMTWEEFAAKFNVGLKDDNVFDLYKRIKDFGLLTKKCGKSDLDDGGKEPGIRQVEVFRWQFFPATSIREKVADGVAVFHAFGVTYQEFESAPGHFSTAIIERSDGSVENVDVELIRFKEPTKISEGGRG